MASSLLDTELPEVKIIERGIYRDPRGYFSEVYKSSELESYGLPPSFVQENLVYSRQGVVRGIHFQKKPHAQGKLLTVLRGELWDVAVDLRRSSPDFGRWTATFLSEENGRSFWIPEGFGHGYFVTAPEVYLLYQVTREWAPDSEAGVVWNDPQLGIDWPSSQAILNERDASLPPLQQAEVFD